MRTAEIKRKTNETDIELFLNIDGAGKSDIATDCGFFNHMMALFASHGNFDIKLSVKGDSEVDYHHTVEDAGIALGQAFFKALGDKRGICRYGSFLLPMDEALVLVSLDISGRPFLSYSMNIPTSTTGDFDTALAEEFMQSFSRNLGLTLHIKQLDGKNAHHIIEAAFKGLARALAQAVCFDAKRMNEIPSTKGIL